MKPGKMFMISKEHATA